MDDRLEKSTTNTCNQGSRTTRRGEAAYHEEKLAPKPKVKKKVYKSKTKLPLPKVHKYIASIYEKKCKADKVDDQKGNERDTLLEFCEDFFSQMACPRWQARSDTN